MATNINDQVEAERRKVKRATSPLQDQIKAGQASAAAATTKRQADLDAIGAQVGAVNMKPGRRGAR